MKKLTTLAILVLLTGCASPKLSLDYRPQSTMELDGAIRVGQFEYKRATDVADNQIPNTALGSGLYTPQPIGEFFEDAVRKEFRQSGLSLNSQECELTGVISKLIVDDLGFSVDYRISVDYRLSNNSTTMLNEQVSTELPEMSKFVSAEVVLNNINKMFSDNILMLMSKSNFNKALSDQCVRR